MGTFDARDWFCGCGDAGVGPHTPECDADAETAQQIYDTGRRDERAATASPVAASDESCTRCLTCRKCAAACDCTGGPVVEAECTCYEITGGHQPGCAFNCRDAPPPVERATHERCEHPCMLCRQDPDTVLPCARPMGHPEGLGCACAAHLVASAPVERAGVATEPFDMLAALKAVMANPPPAPGVAQIPETPDAHLVTPGTDVHRANHLLRKWLAAMVDGGANRMALMKDTSAFLRVCDDDPCPLCSGAGEYQEETATGFVASRCLSCNGTGRATPGTAGPLKDFVPRPRTPPRDPQDAHDFEAEGALVEAHPVGAVHAARIGGTAGEPAAPTKCGLCEMGHRLDATGEFHIPSQRIGMIAVTPCKRFAGTAGEREPK